MFKHRKKIIAIVSMLFVCSVLIVSIPETKAQARFIIADYTYPSNNGNGIAYIHAYLDGAFNATMYKNPDSYPDEEVTNHLDVGIGVNITLAVFCWLNGTHADISSLVEGKTIIRHSVTVTSNNGSTIFSQQNFTYIVGGDGDAPMYFYRYDVILDFLPVAGDIYTVIVTYEIFY